MARLRPSALDLPEGQSRRSRTEPHMGRVKSQRAPRAGPTSAKPAINDLWYKNAVIYCLSVGTYMDANGDGIGDFAGLMRRLDYLHGLGVTAIWLMPFQTSPGRDDGYDVSDYYGVNPAHGTLGDFVEFTQAAKQRGIRVIIDLVVNHTSDQHPWFQDARRNPGSRYRDWYVWSEKRPANADQGMSSPGGRSRRGRTTRRRERGTSTASTTSSPTSTPRTRTSRPRSSRSWGSGSSSACRASAWTQCRSSSPPRARGSGSPSSSTSSCARCARSSSGASGIPSSWPRPTSCPRRT